MEINLARLQITELKRMLSKAEKDLQQSLVDGASWEQVKAKVDIITQINIAINKSQAELNNTD